MEKTRILLVYKNLSTDELSTTKRKLREKYEPEDVPIYHVHIDDAKEFIEEAGALKFIFFETSIKDEQMKPLAVNGTRVIQGVHDKDAEVIKFLNSL